MRHADTGAWTGKWESAAVLSLYGGAVWAFEGAVRQLSQKWHVFQAVYDGHQPENPSDFTSVEQTVDEVAAYLKKRGVDWLDTAYGCSLGGACLTRLLGKKRAGDLWFCALK